jgi:LytR cell envelope-related transcriptional attenuator
VEGTASLVADVRPWRTAAVVASAVAAVELVVLLVIGVALLARPVAEKVKEAAVAQALAPPVKKPKAVPLGAPKLARAETAVLVLNGNGRTGAASVEADRVRAKGYQVASVGDAPRRDYARSLVMFRPGFAPEAHRLARDLRIRIVGPLDGLRPAALQGAHAVVVLGLR